MIIPLTGILSEGGNRRYIKHWNSITTSIYHTSYLVEVNMKFDDAVTCFQTTKLNSPGFLATQ